MVSINQIFFAGGPQLGASSLMDSSIPGAPNSLNPAEITTAPRTPTSPQSRMIPGMDGAGVTTTARSTCSGMSLPLGYALMPSTLGRFGFTGNTAPPKGVLIRFHRVVRPTLPGFSVAPITAILLGLKKTSNGWSLCRR